MRKVRTVIYGIRVSRLVDSCTVTYLRKPLPAALIAAGLICTVTRHAWISTALTIPLLAIRMEQKKRLILYASLALALFLASIPVLGLSDFLASTKTGEEVSVHGHWETLLVGAHYVTSHPFGAGPGNYDRSAGAKHTISSTSDAPWIESSYLMLAAEYGVLDGLCFAAFVLCALRAIWPHRTPLGYAAFGILVGFAVSMMFAPMHGDFALASWIWFPIGLAVRFSSEPRIGQKKSDRKMPKAIAEQTVPNFVPTSKLDHIR
jgi:hypothetical protein